MGVFVMQMQITNFYKNIKIKNHFLFLISFVFFIINTAFIYGETGYFMSITKNDNSPKGLTEFSIYIESDKKEFMLTSYQCALKIESNYIRKNLILKYIDGTSELGNEPNLYVGINSIDGESELTFVSYVGNDIIVKQKKLVGKFIIEGIETWNFNPTWNFDGVISTIITGNNFSNITSPSNHIINIKEEVREKRVIPNRYELSQNYPNPFNSTTKVHITLKEGVNVSLVVYNLLGEKILNIYDGYLVAGVHEINIDAGNLTSGIYIYRLNIINKFSDFKKMNLIK